MTDKKINCLLDRWITDNKSDILEKWMELCRIPSIKSTPEKDAPYGRNCAEALSYSAKLFADMGFKTEVDTEGGYALAYFGEKAAKSVFSAIVMLFPSVMIGFIQSRLIPL